MTCKVRVVDRVVDDDNNVGILAIVIVDGRMIML